MFTSEFVINLVEKSINRAEEYLKNGDISNAELLMKQALRVDNENVKILNMLGLIYLKKDKPEEAITHYEKAHELAPEDHEAINNLALCWSALGKCQQAIDLLKQGIGLYPDNEALQSNLAFQYHLIGDIEEADATYQKAMSQFNSSELRYNYGVFLGKNGRYREAIFAYERALFFDPNHAMARWNRALIDLLIGNYERGFGGYEARWQAFPGFQQVRDRFKDKTEWSGKEDVLGKKLLIYNEQGYGDIIQNLRFIPAAKNCGFKEVILEVPPNMVDLVSQSPGPDTIIPWKKNVDFDYHISINSLPRLLWQQNATSFPYIKPTGSVDGGVFKDYEGVLKIGICWAGSPQHKNDSTRSCYLREFKTIHDIQGVKLFSLQKETAKRYWHGTGVIDLTEGCQELSVVNMSDLMKDFNYTAAIIEQMDLIITVDTVVAHIAGALNKPCWLLLQSQNDWRWGVEDGLTQWYDSIRIFRQPVGGSWQEVFREVTPRIQNYVSCLQK